MKANRITICGRKTMTLPTPAIMPSTTRERRSSFWIPAPAISPTQPTPASMPSITGVAQAKTAWNITNRTPNRMSRPAMGLQQHGVDSGG
jgi:hypothetical protein